MEYAGVSLIDQRDIFCYDGSDNTDIYLSGLLARCQNAWSQDGGNMRVIANGLTTDQH